MIPTYSSDKTNNMKIVVNHLTQLNTYDFTEPHRHDYFEFFYFKKGGGTHYIDFVEFEDSNGEGFLSAVKRGINKFGKPTDNMRNAMVKMIDKRAAQKAEWATRDGKCEFVGTVGERQAFTVTVKHVVELDGGNWGTSYINICRDADDNIVIYKGSYDWGKGNAVECMAKVKDHGVREGVRQTIIQRPTKVKVNGKAWI